TRGTARRRDGGGGDAPLRDRHTVAPWGVAASPSPRLSGPWSPPGTRRAVLFSMRPPARLRPGLLRPVRHVTRNRSAVLSRLWGAGRRVTGASRLGAGERAGGKPAQQDQDGVRVGQPVVGVARAARRWPDANRAPDPLERAERILVGAVVADVQRAHA